MLAEDNKLLVSLYQAKKLLFSMRMEIKRIHACRNSSMLYRNQYDNQDTYITHGTQYKQKNQTKENINDNKNDPAAKMASLNELIICKSQRCKNVVLACHKA